MRKNNLSINKYLTINSLIVVVEMILLFVYRTQAKIEDPFTINLLLKDLTFAGMVFFLVIGIIVNLGIYLFDKYLR